MATIAFDDLIRREQAAVEDPHAWQAEKEEWLRYLDALYGQVMGYLQPYLEQKRASVGFCTLADRILAQTALLH